MNKADETVYLGRIISLLGKHQQLTLGEIKNSTRAFLRKRHQTDSSLFNTLELFVTQGLLRRKVHKSRIYYTLSELAQGYQSPKVQPIDLVESAVSTETELFKQMANQGLKHMGLTTSVDELIEQKKKSPKDYVPKAPPPNSTEGFK